MTAMLIIYWRQATARSWRAQAASRSNLFSILPEPLFGSSLSENLMLRGTLKSASDRRQYAINSSAVSVFSAFFHDAIALAEHDDAGLLVFDLMFGDVGEAHDGEDVTFFSLEGSCVVEDDLARTGIAGDGVGLEAISVCHIAAQDALVRYESALLHQVGGDGQAAFVLQIAVCDCGAVNLRF